MPLSPITRNPTADSSLPIQDAAGDDTASENLFPRSHAISECIRKYGSQRYLKTLRTRYEKGLYDKERFCLLAGQAYLWAGKPWRCLAVLASCAYVRPQHAPSIRVLYEKASRSCKWLTPSCSLNMIVKNEEKNIVGALDSVDDVVDEIVICDTGSRDSTVEIAKSFGATVVIKQWQDDFSAARNEALAQSSGSWVLWMDADDRLSAESKRPLRELIGLAHPHSAAFRVVNIIDGAQAADFMQVRLFPRLKNAKFERRIHEQISACMMRLGVGHKDHSSIVIFHVGYDDYLSNRKKARRNKPLIMAEVADNPQSPVLLLSLADCHMILGETKEALAAYERIVSHPMAREQYPDVFAQAHFNIGLLYRSLQKYDVAKVWLERTINIDSSRCEALYLLGLIAEEQGDGEAAFSYFLACSHVKPRVRQTATDSRKIRIDSIFRVCQQLFDRGRLDRCEDILLPAIQTYPNVVNFHTLLGKIYLCKEIIAEAARNFMISLSLAPKNNPDPNRGMAVVYMLLKDYAKAREFILAAEESQVEKSRFTTTTVSVLAA